MTDMERFAQKGLVQSQALGRNRLTFLPPETESQEYFIVRNENLGESKA
jgi:hypothetical protein